MPCSNKNIILNAALDYMARVYKIRKASKVPVVRDVGGADSVVNDVGAVVVAETHI